MASSHARVKVVSILKQNFGKQQSGDGENASFWAHACVLDEPWSIQSQDGRHSRSL